jgi:hypothetical protein
LLAIFQKRIVFGGAGPAESMAGETSQQQQARLQRNRMRTTESRANETPQQQQTRLQIAGFEIL